MTTERAEMARHATETPDMSNHTSESQAVPREAHSVTVTIPGTIDARLSPNGRAHWRVKNRLVQERKAAAYYALLNTKESPELGCDVTTSLTLHFLIAWEKRRRIMDDDNAKASMKAIIDGIAEALDIDDKHMTVGTLTQTRDPDGVGFIKVAIEETA